MGKRLRDLRRAPPRGPLVRAGANRVAMVLASVALASDAAAPAEGETEIVAKWQQVALEGEYKGYAGGESPFVFDKATFEKMVENFRKHPSYTADGAGVGCSDVIAWDFHHASEYPAVMGEIATSGAPAQGWVQELEVRVDAEGKSSLWALTRWLEPARSYIAEGKYKWASVAVSLDAVDALEATPLGPVLTSIAITNNPFIEGMESLAASKQHYRRNVLPTGASQGVRLEYYAYRADTPEHAMSCLRGLFGLPLTATETDVAAELAKLAGMVAGTLPSDESIDLDDMVAAVRTILGFPTLTTSTDVLTQAQAFISGLAEPNGGDVSATSSSANQVRAGAPYAMDPLKILAAKLGLNANVNPELLLERVAGLLEFRTKMAALFAKPEASDSVLLADAAASGDARAKLEAIAKALGLQDPAGVVDAVLQKIEDAKQLVEIMPELEGLRSDAEARDEEDAMADVAAARDTYFDGNENADELLLMSRLEIGRDAFFERYPIESADRAYLTRDISGTGNPVRAARPVRTPAAAPAAPAARAAVRTPAAAPAAPAARTTAARPAPRMAPRAPVPSPARPTLNARSSAAALPGRRTARVAAAGRRPLNADAADVTDQDGVTLTAKAMAFIKATVPGAKEWDHEKLWKTACEWENSGRVFVRVP